MDSEQNTSSVFLSWGMGVESTAILTRWLADPSSRNFPLSALTVLVAQTGNEWQSTKALCETYILPLLARHRIRLVQVARAGHLEEDGIEVLDDTDQPDQLHTDGAYKLSDELLFAGTVPQFAGVHTCALKFKAFVLEQWLSQENDGKSYSHAFGYNKDETKRIEKSEYAIAKRIIAFGFNSMEGKRIERANEYDSINRESFYPLMEWNWTREDCLQYLKQQFNVAWIKSACVACPFVKLNEHSISRFQQSPEEAAQALLLEYTSLCLNHRSTLYKNRSLMSVLRKAGNHQAIEAFNQLRARTPMATYRVRRIMTSKGHGHRCTEQIPHRTLDQLIKEKKLTPLSFHHDDYNIATGYAVEREEDTFPTREEFYVLAPTTVGSRARYGIPWFEDKWIELNQQALFPAPTKPRSRRRTSTTTRPSPNYPNRATLSSVAR